MSEKIKVKFLRYKNIVLMEVLEMPEKYRDIGTIIEDGDYTIGSRGNPALANRYCYLRGSFKSYDNHVTFCHYQSEEVAKKTVEKFTELINEINAIDNMRTEEVELGFEVTIAE